MNGLAVFLGCVVAAIGLLGVAAPTVLLDVAPLLISQAGLYAAAAFRVLAGVVLILAASTSRMPRTLRVLGALIILGGVITLFIGVDRVRSIVEWWAALGPTLMRGWALLAVAFGSFVVYASRRAA